MEDFIQSRIEVEENILGILLSNLELIADVYETLKPGDFSNHIYSKLYKVLLDASGKPDGLTIKLIEYDLKKIGIFEELGGRSKITELIDNAPLGIAIDSHIEILKTYSVQKKLANICTEILTEIKTPEKHGYKNLIDLAQKKIMDLDYESTSNEIVKLGDVFKNTINNYMDISKRGYVNESIKTGFTEYDAMTGGLNKSDLLILAARPGMGKTAFALNIATNLALNGRSVLMFSLEMPNVQLNKRILSNISNVSMNSLKNIVNLSQSEIDRLVDAGNIMDKLEIYISEKAGVSILEIKNICRRFKIQKNYDLIIIDYLQLINGSSKYGSREQEVSEISRSLKNLARELDVPILALSQLSRSVEGRSDKRPILSDLRESGSIEQDADQVMFLYRDQYYKKLENKEGTNNENEDDNKNKEKEIAELIIGKHRNGETGNIKLGIDLNYQRFINVVSKF